MKYFDYAASTPCMPEVVEAMAPYWNGEFGNPHSRNHEYGWNAQSAIEIARMQIADLINASADEIIFTSGATEANNLAIKGFAAGPHNINKKIVSINVEHKCVLEPLTYLKSKGYDIEILEVESNGLVDLDKLKKALDGAMFLTIAYVNNETGVVQNIPEISKICRELDVCLHVDAAQGFGKLPINARDVDLMSISGHKIYGPKGIGALFVSKKPRVRLQSLINGGGQERNMRPGTLPTPLCVGLGKAAEIAKENMQKYHDQAKFFYDKVYKEVIEAGDQIYLNGCAESCVPYIINLSVPYVEGESLMMKLNNFALASGSACTSKSLEPSHVISAMHPEDRDLAHSSLRVSFGRMTNEGDVDELIAALKKAIYDLRELSPLYSMAKKGIDLKSIKWQK